MLILCNDAYVAFGLTRPHGSTRGEHASHCTTDTGFFLYKGDEIFRIRYDVFTIIVDRGKKRKRNIDIISVVFGENDSKFIF